MTSADRSLFERALALAPESTTTALAAYAFAPHMIWRSLFTLWRAELDGHLCVFAEDAIGLFMLLSPLGAGPVATPLKLAFDLMRAHNRGRPVTRVENVPEELKSTFESLGYRLSPKDPDYLYRAADLAALSGDRHKAQRAACNRLEKKWTVDYNPYRADDLEACEALFRTWSEQKAVGGQDVLAQYLMRDAEHGHREALASPDALGLVGRVMRVEGQVRGYTFGYERSPAVFCTLLEVADRLVPGAAQALFRRSCREAAQRGYTYINTMDAFGLPSLARSKSRYRPVAMVASYTVTEP